MNRRDLMKRLGQLVGGVAAVAVGVKAAPEDDGVWFAGRWLRQARITRERVTWPTPAAHQQVDYRRHVFLKRNEIIINTTFANHVTFHDGYDSMVTDCTFENGWAVVNTRRTAFTCNVDKRYLA